MQAYEDAITATSTEWAPWYVIPADHKHVMQAMAAAILVDTIDVARPAVADRLGRGRARPTRRRVGSWKPSQNDRTATAAPRRDTHHQWRNDSCCFAEFGTGQVFWSMLWFFLFFIWIWLLIVVFGDIFRSHDLSGWGKALWTIFVIFLPYLGVFVYLIARGHKMQ